MDTKKQDFIGGSLVAFIVVVVGGIFYLSSHLTPLEKDSKTLCVNEVMDKHTVVLIDISTELSVRQNNALKLILDDIIDSTDIHERLTIYQLRPQTAIDPLGGITVPLLDLCRPKKASESNPLYENATFFNRNYINSFKKSFDVLLEGINQKSGQNNSPIIEAIFGLSTDSVFSQSVNRKLYVFSDMLQLSKNYSHYTHNVSIQNFREKEVSNKLMQPLLNTTVNIYYINRFDKSQKWQNDQHTLFWFNYFKQLGIERKNYHILEVS